MKANRLQISAALPESIPPKDAASESKSTENGADADRTLRSNEFWNMIHTASMTVMLIITAMFLRRGYRLWTTEELTRDADELSHRNPTADVNEVSLQYASAVELSTGHVQVITILFIF